MKRTKDNYLKDFATRCSKSINLRSKTYYKLHGWMCKIILVLCHFSKFKYMD